MNKSNLAVQFLTFVPILLVPAVVFFLANLVISEQEKDYQATVSQLESDFIQTEKARVRSKVNNMVDLVAYRHSIINQELHSRIQRRVDDAQKIALAIHDFYKSSKSELEIQQLIVETLRTLSWNGGESYIWMIDFDGILQLGPNYLQAKESQSIIDFADLSGRKVIQEEIAIVKNQGSGFLWDTFTKPGEPADKQFKQLAYVKQLGLYNWYLGSAEFLDTATKSTHAQLLATINQVGKGDSDYIFVIDSAGNLLLNYARPDIVGRNMRETKDKNLHALFNKMVMAGQTPTEEFIAYNWINPKTGQVDHKMTYLKKVPGSNWIIGSGFYPKMLERGYDAKLQRENTAFQQKIDYLTTLMWLATFAAIIFASVMSLMFYRVIKNYRMSLAASNNELKDVNLYLEQALMEKERHCKDLEHQLSASEQSLGAKSLLEERALLSRLEEEMQRAWVYKTPLAIVRLELPQLDSLRSQEGEHKVNSLLHALTQDMQQRVEDKELIGRMQAGHFLLILPNKSLVEATVEGEALMSELQAIHQDAAEYLQFELSVAVYANEDSVDQLLAKLAVVKTKTE